MTSVDLYQKRRGQLLQALPENCVVVIAAHREILRSRDTDYPFRQHSDFWYFTGFPEPDAWLLLKKDAQGQSQSLLLCRNKDPVAEVWEGRRFGPEKASSVFGLPACSVDELKPTLLQWLNGSAVLCYAFGELAYVDELLAETLAALRAAPKQGYLAPTRMEDVRPWSAELRLIKDATEQSIMAEAGRISAAAHVKAMQQCRVGMYEYQLEAIIRHHFAMQGARQPAYNTIVGGGENGCILHYTDNQDRLRDGDLVLIDAGCELQGYAADITRTFPVNGRFSPAQAAIYQVVLNAQLAACAAVKPGNSSKDTLAAAMYELTRGLWELGILQGELAELLATNAAKQYFIHGLGHWLGLDVHDVGAYKLEGVERPFMEGMVLTIEPGLYIPAGSPCSETWWDIAVRIEDDLLVIKDGHLNLTDSVPKSIEDIEALMQQGTHD